MADDKTNIVNMGEKAIDPNENKGIENDEEMNEEEIEDNTVSAEEYNAIDSKLDELNSALDFIEEKNDSIYSQLQALLQSNKEIREQLAEQNSTGDKIQN